MQVIIREYSTKDFKEVLEIDREAFNPRNPSFDMYVYLTYGNDIFVADIGNKIVGYVVTMDLDQIRGKIVSIAVRKEFRGSGIGEYLMKRAIERLKEKGKKEISLEVRVSNNVAQNLYEKLGFKIVETIPNYYSDGEDAYYMVLSLSEQ
ncbi:MAG: ribosomal protein S18-alanine N-acetyltransferase [Archaeoglobaceae archaeon]|nr:ribosomal protein S18-alanine N-acetyltransferase [Archaeoglobaceae archaeon]MDW8128299.1 ribosomal protein S18-alanine N-acetyltransferase [Archaeoglobaceae archaeon]